jgi:hypothetical protein
MPIWGQFWTPIDILRIEEEVSKIGERTVKQEAGQSTGS